MLRSNHPLSANHFRVSLILAVSLTMAVAFVGCSNDRHPDFPTAPPGSASPGNLSSSGDQLDAELIELLDSHAGGGGLGFFILPREQEFDKIPQDPQNPLTREKIQLGQMLYHETALGVSNIRSEGYETYSCASCHYGQAGFSVYLPQGVSEGGEGFGEIGEDRTFQSQYDCLPDAPDCQPVRSPSVLNCAYQELMLWNGAFGGVGDNLGTEDKWTPGTPLESNFLGLHGVESQAHGGLLAHRMVAVEASRVTTIPRYQEMYSLAFPGDPAPINRLNTALAIAAFERTILASEAPFQKWLRGNKTSMTDEQKRGAMLFFGKANCVSCHSGPALNSMTFHALGMNDLDGSCDSRVNLTPFGGTIPEGVRKGRGGFTGQPGDMYKFKTPTLYNLADAPFYGHGSSFCAVYEVVVYMNNAVPQNPLVPPEYLSPEFAPLNLTSGEMTDLVAFLEDALRDARLMRYVPLRIPSGNCFPVNDPLAQPDLNCASLVNKNRIVKDD